MSVCIYLLLIESKITIKDLFKILLIILSINVLITWIQYFDILGFRDLALKMNRNFIISKYVTYRSMGLMSGYDLNGIMLALTSLLFILYSDIFSMRKYKKFFLLDICDSVWFKYDTSFKNWSFIIHNSNIILFKF